MSAYEDGERYIFISYSHADGERVLGIVAAMEKRGYRAWYDEHIQAGKQWTAELADKIADCEIFMPFISRTFADSGYCMQEVRHAKGEKRNIVPIRLELNREQYPTELKFLLENAQGFSADSFPTPEAFAARLDNASLFQRCRRPVTDGMIATRYRPVAPTAEFVGRRDIMRRIGDALRDGERPVVLYGVGGIGKSEICRKLFHEYEQGAEKCPAGRIGWAMWRGTLPATFYGQFPGIADENIQTHWQNAERYMRTLGETLLMFVDNADDITDEDEARLTSLGCRFLITSRKAEHSERVRVIEADRLTPDECRTLYRRAYPNCHAPDSALDEIITLAGRHTLAVRLLAKTQKAARLSAEAFLSKLRESGFNLAGKIKYRHTPEQDSDDDENAAFIEHMSRIFDLSQMRKTQKKTFLQKLRGFFQPPEIVRDALYVLQGMSLLAPNTPIAFDALKKWLEIGDDVDGVNRAIETGWLNETPDGDGVSIHAVIAAVVRRDAMPDEDYIDAVAGRLRLDMIVGTTEVFTTKLPILEHAVALERVTRPMDLQTENYAGMLRQMGYLNYLQGNYVGALEWYQQALGIYERVLGAGHPSTATIYDNIAQVYNAQGDYASALEWYQTALRVKECVLGAEHPSTATTYHNIGTNYFKQGDYKTALQWLEKALAVRLKVLGEKHPLTKSTQAYIDAAKRRLSGEE